MKNTGPKAPSYADIVRMEQLAATRARLAEARGKPQEQVRNTLNLSSEAQERIGALENFPHLKDAVNITNDGITVTTQSGEMNFAFSHQEGGMNHADANAQFTKQQLEALVELFGKKPEPYLQILGLKNTHEEDGKKYDYNFYWSSSVHEDNSNYAWGLYLNGLEVHVDYYYRNNRFSAFSS